VENDGLNEKENCSLNSTTKEEVEDMDFELKDGSNGDQFELEGISPTCLLQLSCSWFMHEVTQVWLILNVVKMIAMDQN
jgi:hypothetical protein